MDDAALVKFVAAQFVRRMGAAAIPYLQIMQEEAAALSEIDAQAWRDIEEAARAILLSPASASDRRETEDSSGASISRVGELECNPASDPSEVE